MPVEKYLEVSPLFRGMTRRRQPAGGVFAALACP